MTIDPSRFSKLLGEFKLDQLFNELGWDQANLRPQEVVAEGSRYTLTSIAQKRGVVVFRCSPDASGKLVTIDNSCKFAATRRPPGRDLQRSPR